MSEKKDQGFDGLKAFVNLLEKTGGSGIVPMPSVAAQPGAVLMRWRLIKIWNAKVRGGRSPYRILTGYDQDYTPRVSSPVQRIDVNEMKAVTASGRVYLLDGPPEDFQQLNWVWVEMSQLFKNCDATPALLRLISRRAR